MGIMNLVAAVTVLASSPSQGADPVNTNNENSTVQFEAVQKFAGKITWAINPKSDKPPFLAVDSINVNWTRENEGPGRYVAEIYLTKEQLGRMNIDSLVNASIAETKAEYNDFGTYMRGCSVIGQSVQRNGALGAIFLIYSDFKTRVDEVNKTLDSMKIEKIIEDKRYEKKKIDSEDGFFYGKVDQQKERKQNEKIAFGLDKRGMGAIGRLPQDAKFKRVDQRSQMAANRSPPFIRTC
ncbi:MAG: hypothetical protein V1909_01790 [Candidatus Micrarchaeota archaeon]